MDYNRTRLVQGTDKLLCLLPLYKLGLVDISFRYKNLTRQFMVSNNKTETSYFYIYVITSL